MGSFALRAESFASAKVRPKHDEGKAGPSLRPQGSRRMKAGRLTETPAMTWSAAQYLKFEHERTRPVRDLVAQIPNAEVLVLRDDGTPCGIDEPGELVHRGALVGMGTPGGLVRAKGARGSPRRTSLGAGRAGVKAEPFGRHGRP